MSIVHPVDSNQLYQALLMFNEGGQGRELSEKVDSVSKNVYRLDDKGVGDLYGRLTRMSLEDWERFRVNHEHADGSSSVEQHGAFLLEFAKALVKARAVKHIEKDDRLNQSVAAGEISRFVVQELLSQREEVQAVRIACRIDDSRFQEEVCSSALSAVKAKKLSGQSIQILHHLSNKKIVDVAIARILPRESTENPGFSNFLLRLLDPSVINGDNTAEMRADSVASWACQGGIFDIGMMGQVQRILRAVRCEKQADRIDQHLSSLYYRMATVLVVAAGILIWGIGNSYMTQSKPIAN